MYFTSDKKKSYQLKRISLSYTLACMKQLFLFFYETVVSFFGPGKFHIWDSTLVMALFYFRLTVFLILYIYTELYESLTHQHLKYLSTFKNIVLTFFISKNKEDYQNIIPEHFR